MIGVGISFALFATVRAFARAPPKTMTKEYQEASEAYLQVSISLQQAERSCCSPALIELMNLLTRNATGTKRRANHWCFVREIQEGRWLRHVGSEQAWT